MRDVRPPISFRFDIAQNHIFNWQRQAWHFPRHICTKIIKLNSTLITTNTFSKLTSFETTPCYNNNNNNNNNKQQKSTQFKTNQNKNNRTFRQMLQDRARLVRTDAFRHHVENVVHHRRSQLEIKVRLDTLFGDLRTIKQ